MSNLLLAGLSGSMPWPVKKYTMFWGRSLSPSVAVTCLCVCVFMVGDCVVGSTVIASSSGKLKAHPGWGGGQFRMSNTSTKTCTQRDYVVKTCVRKHWLGDEFGLLVYRLGEWGQIRWGGGEGGEEVIMQHKITAYSSYENCEYTRNEHKTTN